MSVVWMGAMLLIQIIVNREWVSMLAVLYLDGAYAASKNVSTIHAQKATNTCDYNLRCLRVI